MMSNCHSLEQYGICHNMSGHFRIGKSKLVVFRDKCNIQSHPLIVWPCDRSLVWYNHFLPREVVLTAAEFT